MVVRPYSTYMQRSTHGLLYYTLLGLSIAVFLGFSYLSFLAYTITRGTPFFVLSYIVIAPVFVSGFLFILLVAVGKLGFNHELEDLHKYKVEV